MVDFRSVEANLRESFRVLARGSPSGEVREFSGLSIASAGVSFQMFNAAFLSSPVASEPELERRVAEANAHFGARGLEWSWWICDDWLAPPMRRRASRLLKKYDLNEAVELPGMSAEELLPPFRRLPEMEVRRVADEGTRAAFCQIGALCFNVPPPWFREVFDNLAVWRDFAGFVGYVDGTPVSTAATVVAAGVAGVYNVATIPGQQRRGYGECVMRRALEAARAEHGVARSILQSTPQGLRLYQRMGYRTVTKVSVYSS